MYKKKISFIYEIIIILLAFVAVTITILDLNNQIILEPDSYLYWIDLSVLMVFIMDYLVRLILSTNKKQFFKNNIFDLIAIIPFSSMFRIFRAFRILKITKVFKMAKLVKGFALLGKIKRKLNLFIHTNGFIYTIYISTSTILLGTVAIYFLEFKQLGRTFGDSLWWSFVTATTVGYGDITPESVSGRLIAVILMIVGIGFVGMLTGTIATYFLNTPIVKLS
ncbi:potassium channel family protein [Jeotgalibaca sp. MA1X17-3]|uniref:potassium channel family protein n=1 Tax=Jeotgalibaca sp. MA1X17-3 TaxID=2908211 RepID=UPI002107F264|nr:potassium channel family protein [Jeotgalibaca sp. MA1X17-3]